MLRRLAASVVLLALCAGAEPAHRQASKQKSPDKARVAQIQQALVEQHYMPAPTGKWDAETIEALAKLAQDHGWQTCHVPDARALQALGLGSDTAGIGKPRADDGKPNAVLNDDNQYDSEHPETCTLAAFRERQ